MRAHEGAGRWRQAVNTERCRPKFTGCRKGILRVETDWEIATKPWWTSVQSAATVLCPPKRKEELRGRKSFKKNDLQSRGDWI